MYRKSPRTLRLEHKRRHAATLNAGKARKRMARMSEPWTFSGVVRASGPMFGPDVRQLVLNSDGIHVCVDGLRIRTLRGFRAAMARRLWSAIDLWMARIRAEKRRLRPG